MGRGGDAGMRGAAEVRAAAAPAVKAPPPLLERRAPHGAPPVTFAQLKAAVPAHCFERSALRSLAHLAADLACVGACLGFALWLDASPMVAAWPAAVRYAAWGAYALACGCFGTGLWVLAHECGHGAFSASPLLNDLVGFMVHSFLGVPYFSWKYSHARHHGGTNSMERDEVFVPMREAEAPLMNFSWGYSLPVRLFYMVVTFTAGWPLYLAVNAASRTHDGRALVSHFDPTAPIFNKRERAYVLLSDAGLIGAGYGLWRVAQAFGYDALARYYVAPLMVVNFWLVMITWLQHTHPSVPHYSGEQWTWLKGALSTVDRSYGYVLDRVFHRIADLHVAHHLFSYIPFYHAEEVTKIIKPMLGEYYLEDTRPIFKALWEDWAACRYVAPEDESGPDVLWWQVASRPAKSKST